MHTVDAIVVVDFRRDPDESYTKVWTRLQPTALEQRLKLPACVLASGHLIELVLDEERRTLRVDYLRWEHARQTLHVHVVPTEDLAQALRAQGLRSWLFWRRAPVAAAFVERCRRSDWTVRRAGDRAAPAAAQRPVERDDRVEPTL